MDAHNIDLDVAMLMKSGAVAPSNFCLSLMGEKCPEIKLTVTLARAESMNNSASNGWSNRQNRLEANMKGG
jgi:hypothetical protein